MVLKKRFRGVALAKLGIAIAILLIMYGVSVMGVKPYLQSFKIGQAKSDTAALSIAVTRYAYDMENAYPDNNPEQCLPSNLATLASKDSATGCGPWISDANLKKSETSFLDPWGNAYVYTHGSTTDGRFVVYSKGPDGNGTVSLDGTASNGGIGACGGYKM